MDTVRGMNPEKCVGYAFAFCETCFDALRSGSRRAIFVFVAEPVRFVFAPGHVHVGGRTLLLLLNTWYHSWYRQHFVDADSRRRMVQIV